MRYDVSIEVHHKAGVADPEGATIERALPTLGFEGASDLRTGKLISLVLDAEDLESARVEVERMCSTFLTNPVIEDSTIRVEEQS